MLIKKNQTAGKEFLMKMRKLDIFVEGSFMEDWCLTYNLNKTYASQYTTLKEQN